MKVLITCPTCHSRIVSYHMKKLLVLTIILWSSNSFGQYSRTKMDKLVAELTEMVTDSSYINPNQKIMEELDEPIMEYTVNNNMTFNEFSSKRNFSDNEIYSTFQKISKKGKESDFIKMTKSVNPAIRVYGFWALLKNNKLKSAETILKEEQKKSESEQVYWNTIGCEVSAMKTTELMTDILERQIK